MHRAWVKSPRKPGYTTSAIPNNTAPNRPAGNTTSISLTITAVSVGDSNWDQLVLTEGSFETLGPALQDLILHVEMRNTSTAALFELRIAIQKKYLDADWAPLSGSVDSGDLLISSRTADGYTPSSVFSDRGRLGGMRIRLLLQYHAKTGGTIGAKSEVSISAACRLFCC